MKLNPAFNIWAAEDDVRLHINDGVSNRYQPEKAYTIANRQCWNPITWAWASYYAQGITSVTHMHYKAYPLEGFTALANFTK